MLFNRVWGEVVRIIRNNIRNTNNLKPSAIRQIFLCRRNELLVPWVRARPIYFFFEPFLLLPLLFLGFGSGPQAHFSPFFSQYFLT